MTLKERYLRGDCSIHVINDWAEAWRANGFDFQLLPRTLGLTEDEYRLWAIEGERALEKLLSASVDEPYLAIHLDWEELESQLGELVRSLLGTDYRISIKRMDYYYWDLELAIPTDVDEGASAQICDILGLQDIEKDCFIQSEKIENTSMNGLLGRLVQREVASNHADDYGVWVFCKDGRVCVKEGL